ncbi:MAG: UDP-N-acetylglucosamine 2-epimerase (non-hydrolyzing), partial [Candidatus Korarchaeum sp.]|nr:UDP-N-acetylglucosamine 2-epimerase (non-hydrolyzing) [Candidatus Korarchaeum sp.]
SGTHGYQVGEMLRRIEEVLMKEKPSIVVVPGDTNSTLAGALAAVKLKIHVAHVEAGVRSHEEFMPEEINRVLVDHMSSLLFAPTERAFSNLLLEGLSERSHLTGDVMLDLVLEYGKFSDEGSRILQSLGLKPKEYILVTIHRAENTDSKERLSNIVGALIESDQQIVFPAHPRTIKSLKDFSLLKQIEVRGNLKVVKPVSYLNMLQLEKNASKILTDSGGVQKEAYFLKVPCITVRERTEWIETVEDGWNILVGVDKAKILQAMREFEGGREIHINKFGGGKASERICEAILRFLQGH